MLDPATLSPRARAIAAGAIHRAWEWVTAVGAVGPEDRLGRRFRSMGRGSCLAFPPGSVFNENWISIGSDTLIGPNVSLSAGFPVEALDPARSPVLVIGDRCNIGRGSSLVARCRVVVGNDVMTGPGVYITDHNHTYGDLALPIGRQWVAEEEVTIGAGSWLGAGVIVLPGSRIGRHVTVAAGSVVRGELPDNCVAAGTPARIVRRHVEGTGWEPPLKPAPAPPPGWPGSGAR